MTAVGMGEAVVEDVVAKCLEGDEMRVNTHRIDNNCPSQTRIKKEAGVVAV